MPFVPKSLLGLALFLSALYCPAHAQFVSGTNRESTKAAVANYRLHGTLSLNQLLHIRTHEGLLAPELLADLPVNESVRVEIEASDAVWVVRNRNIGTGYLTVTRYDFDAPPDALWSVSLTMRNNYIAIYGQTGDGASGTRARLTQTNKSLRLSITQADEGIQKNLIAATADSVQQLQAEQPDALRRYIAPALRLISGHYLLRPGPTDVYRLFPGIPPAPKAVRELEGLLIRLDAADYTEREEASRALTTVGKPVILAAVRRSKADLSEEARNRLDAFLAGQTSLSIEDVPASREDPYLLLDCFEDEDPAVRAAAHSRLAVVLGATIDFNPSADAAARSKAVEQVRSQVEGFVRAKMPAPGTRHLAPATPRLSID